MDTTPILRGWLLARGVAERDVLRYEKARALFVGAGNGGPVRPWHVDQAVAREERRGVPPSQLAQLKRVGEVLVRFARDTSTPAPYERARCQTPPTIAPARAQAPRPRPAQGETVVVEVGPGAPPVTSGRTWRHFDTPLRCTCAHPGSPVVHDGSDGPLFKGIGGVAAGSVAVVLAFAVGFLGVLGIALAFVAVKLLLSAFSAHFACERCGLRRSDICEEDRLSLDWARLKWFAGALLAAAGAVACAALWLSILAP